jgi:flagellar motor switch protein FliM
MSDSELLSQDEIDALLSGVENGDIDTENPAPVAEGALRPYDFTSQDRIVRGRLPTLEMINERFARTFRVSLFNLLRRSPEINIDPIQMTKFGEYMHTQVQPANLNIVRVNPLRGPALIAFSPKLIFGLVDCFFGGDGRIQTKVEGREFTRSELRLVHKVLQLIFADLQAAWQPVLPVKFEYVNTEVNPQFANIVSPSEVVVISNFQIDLEAGSGALQVALPYSMLEPVREVLDAGIQSDVAEKDERWSTSLREQIKHAVVKVGSTLTTTEISLRDVMSLKAGDVITVEMPDTVVGRAEGVPMFRARYGVSRGNLALKVVERLRRDEQLLLGS